MYERLNKLIDKLREIETTIDSTNIALFDVCIAQTESTFKLIKTLHSVFPDKMNGKSLENQLWNIFERALTILTQQNDLIDQFDKINLNCMR